MKRTDRLTKANSLCSSLLVMLALMFVPLGFSSLQLLARPTTSTTTSRTQHVIASSQLTDRVEAMRRNLRPPVLRRLLAGIADWRENAKAKGDGSSCDLLFDDEEHAATCYSMLKHQLPRVVALGHSARSEAAVLPPGHQCRRIATV